MAPCASISSVDIGRRLDAWFHGKTRDGDGGAIASEHGDARTATTIGMSPPRP